MIVNTDVTDFDNIVNNVDCICWLRLQEQVYKELQSYDKAEVSPYTDSFFGRPLWRPGSGTADDIFQVKYDAMYFVCCNSLLFVDRIKITSVFNRKLAW